MFADLGFDTVASDPPTGELWVMQEVVEIFGAIHRLQRRQRFAFHTDHPQQPPFCFAPVRAVDRFAACTVVRDPGADCLQIDSARSSG
ncbi:hypothetical protein [Burkholderia sp. Ac-20384]|uniref:hypothetical protein n=1 Tax=Burkholderia sp. Ac-20384 TaxID=2703902 RepID=UPI003216F9E1